MGKISWEKEAEKKEVFIIARDSKGILLAETTFGMLWFSSPTQLQSQQVPSTSNIVSLYIDPTEEKTTAVLSQILTSGDASTFG